MNSDAGPAKSRSGLVRIVVSVLLCAVLLGAGGGTIAIILNTEPTAEREAKTRKTAALVEVIEVERSNYRPTLTVLGEVRPARDIVLTPRVSGHIIAMDPSFVPGAIIKAGNPLLRLDPADAERAVTTMRSELLQIESELEIEQGRQRVAQREYELLGEEIDEGRRSLVLREPQIAIIKARLDAARAALELAELNLQRTTIRAPFDAQVLSRSVNIGSQVSAGEPLGRIVGVDEYWIVASVPLRDLRRINFDDTHSTGSPVRVRHSTAWEPGVYRQARVTRLIGEVDRSARLAPVLIALEDPLALETQGQPVILGTLLQLEIEARELRDVIRLDREFVRQNDTVWLMIDGALAITPVTITARDAKHAYITSGIQPGDQVVTTSLATVTQGLPLRTEPDADSLPTPVVRSEP